MLKQLRPRRGVTGVSYGLVVGLIAVVALGAITGVGNSVDNLFSQTSDTLQNVAAPAASAAASASAVPLTCPTSDPDVIEFDGECIYSRTVALGNEYDQLSDVTIGGTVYTFYHPVKGWNFSSWQALNQATGKYTGSNPTNIDTDAGGTSGCTNLTAIAISEANATPDTILAADTFTTDFGGTGSNSVCTSGMGQASPMLQIYALNLMP